MSSMLRTSAASITCMTALMVAGAPARSAPFDGLQLEPDIPWTSAGNGITNTHDAADERILGRFTLPFLFAKWIFTASGEVQSSPTVEGNALYVSDSGGSVWRLDKRTGQVIWHVTLPALDGDPASFSRNSPAIGADAVILGDHDSGKVFALSKATGALLWQTLLATNEGTRITSSPVAVAGRVYVGVSTIQSAQPATITNFIPNFRGSVAALDERTGAIVWQTYTVPPGYSGGAVWGSNIGVDPARQSIYFGTGENYSVPNAVAQCQKAAGSSNAALDACLPAADHIDSLMSLDMNTGAIRWASRFTHGDTWSVSCLIPSPATPCPSPQGQDTDFGSGVNLFRIHQGGRLLDVVGAGQKSGTFSTVDRDTGRLIWSTDVGPGGITGGIEWGTATDGRRIYVPEANSAYVTTKLIDGRSTDGGFWSALDPDTGRILWQTPTFALQPPKPAGSDVPQPPGAMAQASGAVSVANGVLYGEDAAGNFVALDGATGQVLRSFQSGGSSIAAPSIVDGTLYWGSGYATVGTTNDKLYAFWVGLK